MGIKEGKMSFSHYGHYKFQELECPLRCRVLLIRVAKLEVSEKRFQSFHQILKSGLDPH
jgi:hypothetical protein